MTAVLAIPRERFPSLPGHGTWPFDWREWPGGCVWAERRLAEDDESLLQVIPYLVITNTAGEFWCYLRTGGDRRLEGACSCGVGGHVERPDERPTMPGTLSHALLRETREELGVYLSQIILDPLGWLYEGTRPVGRVHIGIIHTLSWPLDTPPRPARGEAFESLGFLPDNRLMNDPGFDLWSRLVAGHVLEARHA